MSLMTNSTGNKRTALEQDSRIEDGEWKWHNDYQFGNGLEFAENLLAPTSPRKLDREGHGTSEANTNKR